MPFLHALTGCDTTSSFFSIGKKRLVPLIRKKGAGFFVNLLSNSEDLEIIVQNVSFIVCLLYDSTELHKSLHNNLHEFRTKLSTVKNLPLCKLPPCEAVLRQHILRVIWQNKLWINARNPSHELGSPFTHGWKKSWK